MAERETIQLVQMDAPKDEAKQGETAGNAESPEKTPKARIRDLRPEKDPMGAGSGNPLTTKPTAPQV